MNVMARLLTPRLLQTFDVTIVVLAILWAFSVADGVTGNQIGVYLTSHLTLADVLLAALVFALSAAINAGLGMYKGKLQTLVEESVVVIVSCLLSGSLLWITLAWRHDSFIGRAIAIRYTVVCCALMLVTRFISCYIGGPAWADRTVRNVLIVGSGRRALKVYRELRTKAYRSHRILGFVDCRDYSVCSGDIANMYLGNVSSLENLLLKNVVDEVIVALPARSMYRQIEHIIATCVKAGISVKYPQDILPAPDNSQIPPTGDGYRLMSGWEPTVHDWRVFAKRCFDIVAASALIALLAPVMVAIAIAIKLTSPGPVFFLQERYGYGRRRFKILKFRTMVPDAESKLEALVQQSDVNGPIFKMKSDPRVTPVGKFLRRTSLDELPQLFNVLIGHMSMVGPRPMSVRDVSRFDAAWLIRRFSVKPGITCLWQVMGRSTTTFERWMELDLLYIERWSLLLDAHILALTIPAVVKGSGAM